MKVTRRGQVTIPLPIRKRLGIDEGTQIEFDVDGKRIVITKKVGRNPFDRWKGRLRTPGDSDKIVRKIRGHA